MDASSKPRLLVITYPYPPMPSVGGNRWLAMANYLRRTGHEVTILTTSAYGSRPQDAGENVVRCRDLISAAWLRRLMRRPPLPASGGTADVDEPPGAMITGTAVPDPYVVTWVPFAAAAARRLIRERAIDCVITTSAYESTHLVPLLVPGSRPPWIADFRDGWTHQPWKPPWPTRLQRRADERLEAKVVTTADRVTVVQRPVGEDFRSRFGIEPAYIPNGWDPDLEAEAAGADAPRLGSADVNLVYTGRLSGPWGRRPDALLEALRRVQSDPAAERLRLVIAGRLDTDERALIAGSGLGRQIRHVGQLSRASAMALQRQADALLLLTSAELEWELPGKVFEYFGAAKPILALAAENETARLIAETGTGRSVPPDDVSAIAEALLALARGELASGFSPRGLEPYTYPEPAARIAREVERLTGGDER